MSVLISICIPAYKNTTYLKRLLDSIAVQTFTGYEIIITDDSPDNSVKEFVSGYTHLTTLRYYRNPVALGTPENWNEAIRRASGEWIKLMHDDDWFTNEQSLEYFAGQIAVDPSASFIFSAYANVQDQQEGRVEIRPSAGRLKSLFANPVTLLSKNIIGPPSVTIYKNRQGLLFNNKLKWLVDIEFYIRYLQDCKPAYIDQILVNIGINKYQVTKESILVREVEIPEYFKVLEITGAQQLKNIMVYDAWWRLMRNLGISHVKDLHQSGYTGKVPPAITAIIRYQQKIPRKLLHIGFFSKCFMVSSYLLLRPKRKDQG